VSPRVQRAILGCDSVHFRRLYSEKSMTIIFNPVTLTDIEPALQHHLSNLSSPVDAFLEEHVLSANQYQIMWREQNIGWASVHNESLLTQFALLPAYRHMGQRIFADARKLEQVQSAFVPTCDEFFLAHALDDYRQLEKQAYFFQHTTAHEPLPPTASLHMRAAQAADIPTIVQHSGDFFDNLERRVSAGEMFISERAGDCVGFGIIEPGRLCQGVVSCGMFVVEQARRQGVGTAIIAHLIKHCRDAGLRPVAGCWYYNHNSKKTLERAGMFTQTRLLKVSF
jgi:GNAT superfamily N-acetyltransferase